MKEYDHKIIEKKWQNIWEKKGVYKTQGPSKRKKMYVLDMFPYPSGVGLHVGHPRGYIGSDVYARMKRMSGFNVLHPMGYDAFGLPAEQYALEHKIHPRKAVEENVATFEKQLSMIGLSYDWSRKVNTTDPKYYKWTEWIFLQIYNSWFDKKKNVARKIVELEEIFKKVGNKNVNAVCALDIEIFTAGEWKDFSKKEKQDILMKYRLAYEGYSEVNWCPQMGTVLANDEIVNDAKGNPVSERGGYPVEKKSMRQWFMRITAYADRLLDNLDNLEWSSHVKEIQRNWIGKSEGSEIEFNINGHDEKIKIFTTRADTIFGATYVVFAPENNLVQKLKSGIKNWSEVEKYISDLKNKTDEDRTKNDKEKTGVELKGVKAINPANGEEIPVWIADYVLASYGTGAVMAVPAHDERDFEFAKKFNLDIKQVILNAENDSHNPPQDGFEEVKRDTIIVFLKNKETGKYALLNWHNSLEGITTGIMGGIEFNQTPEDAVFAEIKEEAALEGVSIVKKLKWITGAKYCASHKKQNRLAITHTYLAEINNIKNQGQIDEKEKNTHTLIWVDEKDVLNKITPDHQKFIWTQLFNETSLVNDGFLLNSGNFDGVNSEEARKKITEFVGGKLVTKYKMRDAIFARQRYWGEPIPLRHDKDGIITEVKIKDLPLELPKVSSYESTGTGESPLAGVASWVKEGYETNTMPGWAGSSWYFLRYMDPKNSKEFASKKALKYWGNVDVYVGGQEHATGHLLYSRFWNNFLYDMGYVPNKEPFCKLKNQGMIMATDGRKMSKRWGNVINPDDIVNNYGADTLRVYEMFMGPFDQSLPWSTESIIGSRRFIDRVYRLQDRVMKSGNSDDRVQKVLHKTIKKVSEDIENFDFNTAISSMMIFMNEIEKSDISKKDFKMFLQILAPFAPHITEELWNNMGEKKSIHISGWPKYDKKKVIDDDIKIAVQVNGKVRGEIIIGKDMDESDVKNIALKDKAVIPWLEGKEIKRFIYIKGRVINIVV